MSRPCIVADHPNVRPSERIPTMCADCYRAIPKVTRDLYESGKLKAQRMVAIGRERVQSCKKIGGGKR